MPKKIYIIHENDDWTIRLTERLDGLKLHNESWRLDTGIVNLNEEPSQVNGSNALRFEINKVKQYLCLEKFGVRTPKTVAAVGKSRKYSPSC